MVSRNDRVRERQRDGAVRRPCDRDRARQRAGVVHAGRAISDTGFEASLSTTMEPKHGDGATITLDLETGIGDVWVYRMAPTRKQLHELEKKQA